MILELDPKDPNADWWYMGFATSFRHSLPYEDKATYEVDLLRDLTYFAPNAEGLPAPEVDIASADVTFTHEATVTAIVAHGGTADLDIYRIPPAPHRGSKRSVTVPEHTA